MGKVLSKEQNIHNEGAAAEIQNNIQGSSNTVNIHYPTTKEPELEDFNFPKPIDSFKGRENEFTQLDDYLFLNDQKMVVIWGLPGFGKSELAKQFAQKCKFYSKIKNICWIQASNNDALEHSLKNLIKILKLPEVDDLRLLLQAVSKRYQDSGTLFVFDDVDSPRSLLDWETPSSCWTLVNSQLGEWGTTPCVQLGPLDHDAAVAVLQHQQDPTVIADPDIRTLAILLDNAPLALQLAAAYIRQEKELFPKNFTILEYIQKLQKSLEKFVDEEFPVDTLLPYEYRIQEAINLSLEKIRNLNKFESNLAVDILNIISYLDLYTIEKEMLLEFSFILNKLKVHDEDEERKPEDEVQRALYVLQSYSFVRMEDGFIRIHGLVQHTLIFYQNKPNANMESYYISCLEYVLNNNYNWHSTTILKQADKKLEIFKKFYDEYESKIIYGYKAKSTNKYWTSFFHIVQNVIGIQPPQTPEPEGKYVLVIDNFRKNKIIFSRNSFTSRSFLGKLVLGKAKKCLIIILDKLGSQAKEVIIDHKLLLHAIDSQDLYMIKLLQKYEKDIIKKTAVRDCQILNSTIYHLNLDILNFILEHSNIDVNARDGNGKTCMYHLVQRTFVIQPRFQLIDRSDISCQMMRVLVDHGASVHDVTTGYSLLHVAVDKIETAMHLKVVEFIVDDLQVDVNKLSSYGTTALHVILGRRLAQHLDDELTSKVVDVLVRLGASVHVKNNYQDSPLDMIEMYENELNFLLPIVSSVRTHDKS